VVAFGGRARLCERRPGLLEAGIAQARAPILLATDGSDRVAAADHGCKDSRAVLALALRGPCAIG
jgi:hypothetical protein